MASKKQKFLRGWLPNEVSLSSQNSADKFSPVVQWTARALVIGAVLSSLLLVSGDIAGFTQGAGAYLWYAGVECAVWGAVAAVPFLVKRKTDTQGRNQA